MLKTTKSFEKLASRAFKASNNKVVGGGESRADKTVVNLSKNEKSRKSTHMLNIRAMGKLKFLTFNAKKAFNHLQLAFTKALIFRHVDLKSHIQIETDLSGYAIGGMLSQLNFGFDIPPNNSNKSDFNQWHPVAYFSRKMIPIEIQYKTHNTNLLAIVETFKTWRHYLESCKHEMLVSTNQNNLQQFMNTKSLSSCQVK